MTDPQPFRSPSPEALAVMNRPADLEAMEAMQRSNRAIVSVACGHAVATIDRGVDGVHMLHDVTNKAAGAKRPTEFALVPRPTIDELLDVILDRGCEVCSIEPVRRLTGDPLPRRQ